MKVDIASVARELNRDNNVPIPVHLQIQPAQLMQLLGLLQLVLRHPAIDEQAAATGRQVAEHFEKYLADFGPATRSLCAAGWDPGHDDVPHPMRRN